MENENDIIIIKDYRPSHWSNINIEEDLEFEVFEYDSTRTKKQEITGWIRDKRSGNRLEVILDPMITRYPKIYPYGNFVTDETKIQINNRENTKKKIKKDENEKNNVNKFGEDKLQDAKYLIRLESQSDHPCIKWLKKLEQWFVYHGLEKGLWKQEWNDLREKEDENDDENNDNADEHKKEQKLKKRFVRNLASMVKKKLDKDTGQPIENQIFLTISEKVYNTYPVKNNATTTESYEWTHLEQKLFENEIKEGTIHKNILPFYDSMGISIDQHNAEIKNNDEIVVKVKFKKRDMMGYGLTLKPIWIQLVKEGKENNNNYHSNKINDGPINYGSMGTPYTRGNKTKKIE